MKLIDASRTRLGKLKNRVKICTAQCKNLVQTFLEGLEHMKETYDMVIENDDQDLWDLYSNQKMRYLVRSLDKLLFILETIEDLVRTCGRRWSRMGLSVSAIPFALSKEKTITKFDIFLKELSWNLDIIHNILALSESAKLEWNEDKGRYVLQSDSGAGDVATTEIESIGTNSRFCEDRAHLLTQLRNDPATNNAPPLVSSGKKPMSASYLAMELMQRDLQREIRRITRKIPDDVTVDILLQIVEAMSHMHDCGVIHRDLKAKNCLVNPRLPSKSNSDVHKFYTVKLADFDTSKMLDPDASINDHTLRQGTTRWMAPEVWGIGVYVQGEPGQKSTYDNSIDVYSFGMTCYEVISGEVP